MKLKGYMAVTKATVALATSGEGLDIANLKATAQPFITEKVTLPPCLVACC